MTQLNFVVESSQLETACHHELSLSIMSVITLVITVNHECDNFSYQANYRVTLQPFCGIYLELQG